MRLSACEENRKLPFSHCHFSEEDCKLAVQRRIPFLVDFCRVYKAVFLIKFELLVWFWTKYLPFSENQHIFLLVLISVAELTREEGSQPGMRSRT